MDEASHLHLREIWQANERRLEAARDLKAGPESPIDRIEELEADQDAIEYELGMAYLENQRRLRECKSPCSRSTESE